MMDKPGVPKTEPDRVLTESESRMVDISTMSQQNLDLKEDLLQAQKRTLAVQEENLKLQRDAHSRENDKLLASLNLSGTVNLLKDSDGRYTVKKEKA